MDYKATEPTWWITHGETVSSGFLSTGSTLSTGANFFETFSVESDFQSRLREIKDNPEVAKRSGAPTEPFARLAWVRWKREVGGLTLPNGLSILTSRESQSQITATILSANLGLIETPVRWKAKSGWTELSLEQLMQVASGIAGHVKACFAAEEAVETMLTADPTVNVEVAFDAAYIEAIK